MDDAARDLVTSPVTGTVIFLAPSGPVGRGTIVAIVESMKMEYAVTSPVDGVLTRAVLAVGDGVLEGHHLVEVVAQSIAASESTPELEETYSLASVRLEELRTREGVLGDEHRPEAMARRHERGLRSASENVADLVDAGSFVEYGRFAYAAQSQRRAVDDLINTTPRDGLIAGIGTVNASLFGADHTGCAVLSYDYTVLAGTQGSRNHQKKDRLFELIDRMALPVVFFTEGGGGRPGDTDHAVVTGLDTDAFRLFARLSGQAPMIGIAAGRCFAGNAALLGCCDVVIACEGASIGMGGPAMIEGGGLGVVAPEDVGPVDTHSRAGSVDLVVANEAEAVRAAKTLLAYWQGSRPGGVAPDQAHARTVLPEDRRRAYDVRPLLDVLFDVDSITELRAGFGRGIVTALARLDGRAVGVIANNPVHLAGAIDADGADKAARFLQLLESWGLAVVSLVDTPGFMVGPQAEATGLVRHVSRLFVAGAALSVPMLSVITRRGYGLGAQAMCGGSFVAPLITLAWPQAELGGMGLEGAVRLGFRRELEAIDDPGEREAALAHMIDRAYEHGRALNVAAHLEIDDVIDPAATREILIATLRHAPRRRSDRAPRRFIDTW